MKNFIKILFIFLFIQSTQVLAETSFREIQLSYGVSIKVPSHWQELPTATQQNVATYGQSVAENSGIETGGQKETLLAVYAPPTPTGAIIRVSVSSPSPFASSDIIAATPKELEEVTNELFVMLKQAEPHGGPRITAMHPARIEYIHQLPALVFSYTRVSFVDGESNWLVTQYKIPQNNRLIEITLSYRLSEALIWKPILERVKNSISFI